MHKTWVRKVLQLSSVANVDVDSKHWAASCDKKNPHTLPDLTWENSKGNSDNLIRKVKVFKIGRL